MPLFNYGRDPGYAPGGRAVSYSPNESKAFKILADTNAFGAQPGQYSQKEIDWANSMLPSAAPGPMINRRLASVGGISNPLDAFTMGIQKWGNPATNANAINMFNQRHQANLTPQNLGVQVTGMLQTPQAPAPVPMATVGATTPNAQLAGEVSSFDTQWNDQNDPGGFIRKHQQQIASQPWSSNLGQSGLVYGVGRNRSIGG